MLYLKTLATPSLIPKEIPSGHSDQHCQHCSRLLALPKEANPTPWTEQPSLTTPRERRRRPWWNNLPRQPQGGRSRCPRWNMLPRQPQGAWCPRGNSRPRQPKGGRAGVRGGTTGVLLFTRAPRFRFARRPP